MLNEVFVLQIESVPEDENFNIKYTVRYSSFMVVMMI